MDWRTRLLKRAMDVAGASVALAATAPLFPVIAAAVRLTSKGPILYSQTRCAVERRTGVAPSRPPTAERRRARGFHTFQMYKFRTMRSDAAARTGAVLAQQNDPRLTLIGGFLRRTRLDELPQLVHVLKGDMSLVGPRPERPELMAKLEATVPFFEERMRLIKPGITGLAQIKLNYDGSFNLQNLESQSLASFLASGGTDTQALAPSGDMKTFSNKLLYDLAYSAMLEDPWQMVKTDLEILVKTPMVMLLGKGR